MFQEQEDEVVVDSAETTTEDNQEDYENEGQGEDEEKSKETQKSTETPEQRRARIKRQYEREFGKDATKESRQEGGKEVDDERYQRLELKTEGITAKKEQDIVIDYAKYKGIDVTEAAKSPIVKAELAELRAKTNVPAPSNRTGTGANNSFDYWVGQAKKGNFPRHDKEMMKKLEKSRIFTK
jgi:predicted metal-dependent phosphoesterase TrpH